MPGPVINGFFLIIFLPAILLMIFMPYLTRKNELFGVTIPSDQSASPDLNRKRKQYAISSAIWGLFLCLILFFFRKAEANILPVVFLVTFIIGSFGLYSIFHIKLKKRKAEEQWEKKYTQQIIVDTTFRMQKPVYSLWWYTLPFIIALFTLAITVIFYSQIPAHIPEHYDSAGHVTATMNKTSRFLYFNIALQVYMTALFAFLHATIGWAKQHINPEDPDNTIRRNNIFRRRWSLYMILSSIILVMIFGVLQMGIIWSWPGKVQLLTTLIGVGLMMAGAIVLSFTTGQSGSRLKLGSSDRQGVISRDDDRYWKLGLFYLNRNDPSLFIEKRFGIGWTLNLAHPTSYMTLIIIIVALFIIKRIFI